MSSIVNMHNRLHSPTVCGLLFISMLSPFDSLTHLFLQQLFEGLLGLLFCVPLVSFLLKFRPFFLWDFNTERREDIIELKQRWATFGNQASCSMRLLRKDFRCTLPFLFLLHFAFYFICCHSLI